MGISDLTKILKENCPDCYVKIPIYNFSGKRIAIDAHNLIYRYFSVQNKEEIKRTDITKDDPNRHRIITKWIWSIIDFALNWIEYGVTPVFVFDGTSRIEKDDTKKKRADTKKISRDAASNLLSDIRNQDIFDLDYKKIEEAKKFMSQDTSIRTSELELLILILRDFGFPVITSIHDAEQYCASLCIEGKVEAVFSTDSDTLTFGCSTLLTDFDREDDNILHLKGIDLNIILETLNISFETFVDLCIMCGCDFNERSYGIGPKKSLNYILNYGRIENIPDIDTTPLKYDKCREIFSYQQTNKKDYELNIQQSSYPILPKEYEYISSSIERKIRLDKFKHLIKQLPPPDSRKYSRFPVSNSEIIFI
jgi:flap endonuclease-1